MYVKIRVFTNENTCASWYCHAFWQEGWGRIEACTGPLGFFSARVPSKLSQNCKFQHPIDWISLFSDYYLRLVVFIYFLEIGYDELPKYLRRFCLLSCFFRSIFDIRENQKSIYFLNYFLNYILFFETIYLISMPGHRPNTVVVRT